MTNIKIKMVLTLVLGLVLFSGCTLKSEVPVPSQVSVIKHTETPGADVQTPTVSEATFTPTAIPSQLTVCLGSEPDSLFPYKPSGWEAQLILAAIYDGPFEPDENLNNVIPIIIEKYPALDNDRMHLDPVTVNPGERIVDSTGDLVTLSEGVIYRPAGCMQRTCEVIYTGSGAVQMNQWVLEYTLLPGLNWSDGTPLTADDSLYGYEVAQALFPMVKSDLLNRTASYSVEDERTVEWKGLPGYQDGDAASKFFTPLPRHAWGDIPMQELLVSETAARSPLGWGAYVLQEWQAGEQIVLERNPNYFRTGEGLSAYDRLVFRFVPSSMQSADAIHSGECDILDPIVGELPDGLQVFRRPVSWTVLMFGIQSTDQSRSIPFANPTVRQAAAMCIDRAAVAQVAGAELAEAYIPVSSFYFDPQAVLPSYNPAAGRQLLESAGWKDMDNDPSTPLMAEEETFAVSLYVSPDPILQKAAGIIQQGLADCGIELRLETLPATEYLASGPGGLVFGRNFDLAMLAWQASTTPPCGLLLSSEVPGVYPAYPKGWSGANATGYASEEYDIACSSALTGLPGDDSILQNYAEAQRLQAQDLPWLPLYWQLSISAAKADLCNLAASDGSLSWWIIDEIVECSE